MRTTVSALGIPFELDTLEHEEFGHVAHLAFPKNAESNGDPAVRELVYAIEYRALKQAKVNKIEYDRKNNNGWLYIPESNTVQAAEEVCAALAGACSPINEEFGTLEQFQKALSARNAASTATFEREQLKQAELAMIPFTTMVGRWLKDSKIRVNEEQWGEFRVRTAEFFYSDALSHAMREDLIEASKSRGDYLRR